LATDFRFRRNAVKSLTNAIGVYALCDLDGVPVYVGQSSDGIRNRVARHLTSARSDIIANRQIDVWEIAWVWAYPVVTKEEIGPLEALLYHYFNPKSQLMNGTVPALPASLDNIPEPSQKVQVMNEMEIIEKRDPVQRLPRQAAHYPQIVGHFLEVKESKQIARAMAAHFQRLAKYHQTLLGIAATAAADEDQTD
jgi:GIY-YIG catalytic domain